MPTPKSERQSSQAAASELMDVVMLAMQVVGSEMRRTCRPLKRPVEPGQWSMLFRISEGRFTMTELADYRVVSLPTISKAVELFVRNGWVKRWIDKADRRQTLVGLTPKGRRTLDKYRLQAIDILVDRIEVIPPDTRTHLAETLNALAKALSSSSR